jgi:hypothetical protein
VTRFGVLLGLSVAASLMAATLLKISPPAQASDLVLTSKKIPLNPNDLAQVRVGELIYRGGVEIRSPNRDFGGLSGLRLWDNNTALAVSDAGAWISFSLVEKKGRLVGVKGIGIAPVLDKDGKAGVKSDRDIEAVSRYGRQTCIALEGKNALWCYDDIDPGMPQTFATPAISENRYDPMLAWPVNGGPEVMAISQSNDVEHTLVISEDARSGDNQTEAFIVQQTLERFVYQSPDGFKPTDAAFMDVKNIVVLHRHFSPASGVAAVIGVINTDTLSPDTILAPREIARLAPPLSVDNMEGIAYVERPGSKNTMRKFIYIVSDDNFSGLQRTILMKFEWVPNGK